MRALVYGGGAVGLGLASCLLKSEAEVEIIARDNTVKSLKKDGLVRTGIFGDLRADPSAFGSLFGESLTAVVDLCESINKGDIPCRPAEEIGKDIWAKMLYNCALNPLGAILDVPYGTLAEYESTRKIMDGIAGEVFDVMTSAGYRTHWPDVKEFLAVFYGKLVPDTAEHKSSTLQDIAAQKRTEIDALSGAVVKLATESKIGVPYNSAVCNMVKFIETKSSRLQKLD